MDGPGMGKIAGLGATALGALAAIGRALAWLVGWGMKPYDTKLDSFDGRLENVELSCAQSAKREDIYRLEHVVESNGAKTAFDIAKISDNVERIFQSVEVSREKASDRFETESVRISGLRERILKLEAENEAR